VGGLDIHNAPVVGYMVSSNCTYLSSIAYPDEIEAALTVIKIGNSSVTYGVAVFKKGESIASAKGEFVHVFVNRKENKSVAIPENIREALGLLLGN
jgi:acyl-CoA thioester hydrolase